LQNKVLAIAVGLLVFGLCKSARCLAKSLGTRQEKPC